jgi:hypothetical protein
MFIFFECVSCLILAAIVVTLLFAVGTLLIALQEGATILGRLARRMAFGARVLVARQTELIRNGLSAVGFGLRLNEHEKVSVSIRRHRPFE